MQIRVGFETTYLCPAPTPMILALSIHYSRAVDLVHPDHLLTAPAVPVAAYRDLFGNWCSRIVAPEGPFEISSHALVGDMGTEPPYGTSDFAAWFEAYLDDRWYAFDPRNNTPRSGRVLISRRRDACDVALVSTFGPNTLQRFNVWTDEVVVA